VGSGLGAGPLEDEVAGFVGDAPRHMRQDWHPQETQRAVAEALVRAVSAARRAFGATDFRWFDSRDADSSMSSIEAHYGLTRDEACIRSSPSIAFRRWSRRER
jgi:hypothetical protein